MVFITGGHHLVRTKWMAIEARRHRMPQAMAPNAQFIPGHGESTTILGFVSKPLTLW